MCLMVTGIAFAVLGLLLSLTGIGAVVGLPLAAFGLLLIISGFAGTLIGLAFYLLKLVVMIIFSPVILLFWLVRWLWQIIF
ncbi:MAG TPA: hypothetical protein GXX29_09935 [Firmicutes bacterium]|nr:hypothetical protein [Bacillota bacterium]